MTENQDQPHKPKPFLGVHLKCCNVYIRLHQNHSADAFVGFCPKCAIQVRVPIVAEGGSSSRFFSAS